uniref:lipid scramblase CLPTM1L-like n=1 Tax=Panthera onca TaxID=9690 RepID=UPI002955C995
MPVLLVPRGWGTGPSRHGGSRDTGFRWQRRREHVAQKSFEPRMRASGERWEPRLPPTPRPLGWGTDGSRVGPGVQRRPPVHGAVVGGVSRGVSARQRVGAGGGPGKGAASLPCCPSRQVINRSSTELPLTVSYDKISLGRLRFWIHMQDAVYSLQQFGFSEKDADEVKGIFVDTNLYFLALTFFVAAFHLLFDFLAFKNDISFWKKKRSMIGMSTKAVLWRGFSTVVIFLFLLDEQTSLLVLVPAGIGAAIELWKVKKALKMSVVWRGLRPHFQVGICAVTTVPPAHLPLDALCLPPPHSSSAP